MGVGLSSQRQGTDEGLRAVPGGSVLAIRENSWDGMSLKSWSCLGGHVKLVERRVTIPLTVEMNLREKSEYLA